MLDESLFGPSSEPTVKGIKKILNSKVKDPIDRPRLPDNKKNICGIKDELTSGNAIIGWYCLLGQIDSFYGYRKEKDLLFKFKLITDAEGDVLLPQEVRKFNDDTIIDLWNEEWSTFSRIYVDDGNLVGQRTYALDVTEDEIKTHLLNSEIFCISEDRFIKKPISDGNR